MKLLQLTSTKYVEDLVDTDESDATENEEDTDEEQDEEKVNNPTASAAASENSVIILTPNFSFHKINNNR